MAAAEPPPVTPTPPVPVPPSLWRNLELHSRGLKSPTWKSPSLRFPVTISSRRPVDLSPGRNFSKRSVAL